MSTHAIHLELVGYLSADEFILALDKFMNRCGLPKRSISDNAEQFRIVADFVKMWFKEHSVQNHLTTKGVEWQFIAELSPWHGGFYEWTYPTYPTSFANWVPWGSSEYIPKEVSCVEEDDQNTNGGIQKSADPIQDIIQNQPRQHAKKVTLEKWVIS